MNCHTFPTIQVEVFLFTVDCKFGNVLLVAYWAFDCVITQTLLEA